MDRERIEAGIFGQEKTKAFVHSFDFFVRLLNMQFGLGTKREIVGGCASVCTCIYEYFSVILYPLSLFVLLAGFVCGNVVHHPNLFYVFGFYEYSTIQPCSLACICKCLHLCVG